MKQLILLCILAPLLSSCQAMLDSDGWMMQEVNSVVRVRRQAQHQNYQQQQQNYRPLSQAPANIQQLLQFQQAREPLVNIPAQPQPNLHKGPPAQPVQTAQGQLSQYQPQVQIGQAPQQPNYKSQAAAFANQYRPQQQQGSQQYAPQPQGPPQYAQQPQQYQG